MIRSPTPVSPPLVPDLVELAMVRDPEAVAIDDGTAVTYAELSALADAVAWRLRERGVGRGNRIGVALPRNAAMVAALVAIWRCGAVSVPLPLDGSKRRIAAILDDCDAACVLALGSSDAIADPRTLVWETVVIGDAAGVDRVECGPADTAYVLYTSGSTGAPKGVVMSHGSFANLVEWQVDSTASTHGDRALRQVQFTPLTFDVSYLEIFACLAAGGTLVVPDDAQRRDPAALFDLMEGSQATSVFLPHVMLHAVARVAVGERRDRSLALAQLVTGGEQLIVDDELRRWLANLRECVLQNIYGPTETHVVTHHVLSGDPWSWPALPPIGRAIPGATIVVRDEHGRLAAPGEEGELAVSGVCVADGYLGQEELTRSRFVPDPIDGKVTYLTGDIVRDLGDGVLQYVGRRDRQVKISGVVVDPTTVESALGENPGVIACAVEDRLRPGGERRLIAYVVAKATLANVAAEDLPITVPAHAGLTRHLLDRLPDASVPSAFVFVESLPLSSSGKIDRRRLPSPDRARLRRSAPGVAASTQTERRLLEIWEDLLELDGLGTADRFFEVGGNSLLLVSVQARINREFGRKVGVADLMELATVAGIAECLDGDPAPFGPDVVARRPNPTRSPDSLAARRDAFRDRGRSRRARRAED